MADGVDKIIQQIEEKSKKKEESILQEGKEKAEQKKLESEREAEKVKKKILENGKREAERTKRRILANARRKSRQRKLEAREEIIEEVFDLTKDQLDEMRENSEEYKDILKNVIVEAGLTVGGGELEVLISEEDEKLISDSEVKEISKQISEKTGKETKIDILTELSSDGGGAIARKSDGRVACNNTFGARLKRMKSSLRPKIADILFED